MLRVVRDREGSVTADPSGSLAGRGAYVCHDLACVDRAITSGALARALRKPVQPGLRERLAAAVTPMKTAHDMTLNEGGARGQE